MVEPHTEEYARRFFETVGPPGRVQAIAAAPALRKDQPLFTVTFSSRHPDWKSNVFTVDVLNAGGSPLEHFTFLPHGENEVFLFTYRQNDYADAATKTMYTHSDRQRTWTFQADGTSSFDEFVADSDEPVADQDWARDFPLDRLIFEQPSFGDWESLVDVGPLPGVSDYAGIKFT
ncbi:hypothetical protein FK268_22020 [Tsukamurella sputi]|uniref:Uncharacterized protein n=1 Tax=Tsukamurella sputi TaxID=2591848 RepID=A0A5C5RGA8_9ACTN|nr:hypothetical protein [Tsukamurella sputi]TWS22027.1 hypothetical protein FK268_22020 [Tsukamurella sputi]